MPGKHVRKESSGPATDRHYGGSAPDLLWGLNAVHEALVQTPRRIHEVLILKGKAGPRYQEIIDAARSAGIRLRFVGPKRLGVPAGIRHQGVVARQSEVHLLPLDELIGSPHSSPEQAGGRILAIDSIQDPHNLGAVLRSALAAGFTSVILTRERSAPFSGTVSATSAGAVHQLRICRVVNLAETLKTLKKKGFWIFGAVADSRADSIYTTDFSESLCLVIGSEGKGIRPLVQKQCDLLVTIPLQGGFDSLNVSVAAAVIMFEIVRRQG
jgi:23S rRNA (guanosine2251-2'-O)-methyltransferase